MTTPDTGSLAGTALDTLGSLLSSDLGRDAIHLATVAVTSAERLFPGQHVGLVGEKRVSASASELIGIVDPFLSGAVLPEHGFWLVLYPRTITSLRHVWTHPAFEGGEAASDRELSRLFLEGFAKRLFSYEEDDDEGTLLEKLIAGIEDGGAFGTDIEYGDDVRPSAELYRHYERYTGKPAPVVPEYFRCAC